MHSSGRRETGGRGLLEGAVEDGVAVLADPGVPVAGEETRVDFGGGQRLLLGLGVVHLVVGADESRAGECDGVLVELLYLEV